MTAGGGSRRYSCPFCGRESEGTALACPACGAPVDVQAVVAPSGWIELPAIRDMARIEFGGSSCQIEGLYVPVADFNLAAGDGVYFTHHVLLWKDPGVPITTMPLAGGWSRMLAGFPVVMTEARGPGHIAFSQDAPGEMMALPLQPGESVDVREHVFVAATSQVRYDFFSPDIFFRTGSGNERPEYPVGYLMDRFTAESPGLVLVHGSGNVFERRLARNEMILVKPTALLFKDSSVAMELHRERPLRGGQPGSYFVEYFMWLRLFGPGRVAIQSAFAHFEDRRRVQSSSPCTTHAPLTEAEAFGKPRWSYAEDGETKGPLRIDQLQGLIDVGRLPSDVPVWTEGMKAWTPAELAGRGLHRRVPYVWARGGLNEYVTTPTQIPPRVAATILVVFFALFGVLALIAVLGRSASVARQEAQSAQRMAKACDAGKFAECYFLALQYRDGHPSDGQKAVTLLERACDGRFAPGCMTLANTYKAGAVVPRDPGKALGALARACDAGEVVACASAGYAFANGEGVPVDLPRSIKLYKKACDAANAAACSNLGYMFEAGKGVRADAAAARALYLKGCQLGEPYGCNNLGSLYEQGEGGPRDLGGAEQSYRQACNHPDPRGCYELGRFYLEGRNGPKDPAKAAPFLQKACQGKYQEACDAIQKKSGP